MKKVFVDIHTMGDSWYFLLDGLVAGDELYLCGHQNGKIGLNVLMRLREAPYEVKTMVSKTVDNIPFEIASQLGYLLRMDTFSEYYVMSRVAGLQMLEGFWKERSRVVKVYAEPKECKQEILSRG